MEKQISKSELAAQKRAIANKLKEEKAQEKLAAAKAKVQAELEEVIAAIKEFKLKKAELARTFLSRQEVLISQYDLISYEAVKERIENFIKSKEGEEVLDLKFGVDCENKYSESHPVFVAFWNSSETDEEYLDRLKKILARQISEKKMFENLKKKFEK